MNRMVIALGEAVRTTRKNKNLSQEALAEKVGVCKRTIIDIEKNSGNPKFEILCTLVRELDLPLRVVTPAFVTSELKHAFLIGFLLYIPFSLIDVIVSSTLMSMGMIMLPPAMISTPFKILLFIMLDGWHLLFSSLVRGINW